LSFSFSLLMLPMMMMILEQKKLNRTSYKIWTHYKIKECEVQKLELNCYNLQQLQVTYIKGQYRFGFSLNVATHFKTL
jgi:hypothetical protein